MVWIAIAAIFTFQLASFAIIYVRISRRPRETHGVREGMDLIESKLNALQDFLESADSQVRKMQELISVKSQQLDLQMQELTQESHKIGNSLLKAQETIDLFQERIPHEEFLDRKNAVNYVKAARMAHEGISLAEIARQIDIPMNELELICKLNKDSLMMTNEDLPSPEFMIPTKTISGFSPPLQQVSPELSSLGERFRNPTPTAPTSLPSPAPAKFQGVILDGTNSKGQAIKVKKVTFPKIEL